MSLANREVSAALLYSGNTYTRIKEMMYLCKISFIGRTSYHAIQSKVVFPMVDLIFKTSRQRIMSDVKNPVELAGDGRCDSPGYSTKYRTYTVLDTNTNKIIEFSIVHIGTVSECYG